MKLILLTIGFLSHVILQGILYRDAYSAIMPAIITALLIAAYFVEFRRK